MSKPHDEPWCDHELERAERVLQYLKLRDALVMEHINACQMRALKQSTATKQVLLDFQALMGGTAKYQESLLSRSPSVSRTRCHLTDGGEAHGTQDHPPPQDMGDYLYQNTQDEPQLTPDDRTDDYPPEKQRGTLPPSQAHAPPRVRPYQKTPGDTPVTAVGSPTWSRTRQSRSAALMAISRRNTGSTTPRPLRQSSAARELSEARIRVLNRRKIVAERRKNRVIPLQIPRDRPQYSNMRPIPMSKTQRVLRDSAISRRFSRGGADTPASAASQSRFSIHTQAPHRTPSDVVRERLADAHISKDPKGPKSRSGANPSGLRGRCWPSPRSNNGSAHGPNTQPRSRGFPEDGGSLNEPNSRAADSAVTHRGHDRAEPVPLRIQIGPRQLAPSNGTVQQRAPSHRLSCGPLRRIPES